MSRPTIGMPSASKMPKMPTKEDMLAIWNGSGLKEKILYTLALILLFRVAAHIPVWGVDVEAFSNGAAKNLIGMLDLFTGGALGKVSIVGLGIGPYITSSIIMQLMSVVFPHLEQLQKEEGEEGRRKISQYSRYLTIGLSLFQSAMICTFIVRSNALLPGVDPVLFVALCMTTLTAGAVLALWVSEMITAKGIGNGGSILVFIGIVSRLPFFFGQIATAATQISPAQSLTLLAMIGVFLATIAFVVILQEAHRKVFVISAKRQVGNKLYGGQSTHIPFKLNPGSVMPIIFAFAVMAFPTSLLNMLVESNAKLGSFEPIVFYLNKTFATGGWLYIVFEVLMIFFFTFFYASIMPNMQPRDIAEQLKKYGSSIPGIKPGKPTSDYLQTMLTRVIFIGACAMAIIAFVPNSLEAFLGQSAGVFVFRGLGATSLIILVGVALDLVNQIRTNLLSRTYEGFLKP